MNAWEAYNRRIDEMDRENTYFDAARRLERRRKLRKKKKAMNLADVSKLSPAQQKAVMADQARASAARERVMAQIAQVKVTLAPFKMPAGTNLPYGDLLTPPAKSPAAPLSVPARGIPKGPKVSETHIQQAVVRWWRDHCHEWQLEPELLFAIPNQARRSRANAGRMLAEGLLSGVPDVLVAVPRGDCGGFWIEFKSRDGVLSENQRLMLARLTKIGYATVVVRSAAEAQAAITAYLNMPTRKSGSVG